MKSAPSAAIVFTALLLTGPRLAAADAGEAGAKLWEDFQEKYAANSYKALPPDELDLKARKALISALGVRYRSWTPDKAPTLPELVSAVRQNDPTTSSFDLTEKTLAALMPAIDRFGSYCSGAEISQLREAARHSGGQISLIVEQDDNGRFICFPDPDGPASAAGVNYGSELLEVNGEKMEKKPLTQVHLALVDPGPSVTLKIRQPQGKIETLVIPRAKEALPAVSSKKGPSGLIIRFRRFEAGSASMIRDQLTANQPVTRLTLDMRDNPGGLRDEAVLAASLFLPEKTVIGHFKDSRGEQNIVDGNGVTAAPESIRILMDRRSASSAEFLAASLREDLPDKVKIYGETSYGKSYSTINPSLYGGGTLTVTECLMTTASGASWEKGLKPDVVQKSASP